MGDEKMIAKLEAEVKALKDLRVKKPSDSFEQNSLIALVIGTVIVASKYRTRATKKFYHSLLTATNNALSKVNYSVLPREPIQSLPLRDASKAIALVGDPRSGKTIFLANCLQQETFPWWSRLLFPPRGLYLTGNQRSPTIHDWLKNEMGVSERKETDPWSVLLELLKRGREEQRFRQFLHEVFRTSLPHWLQPQPSIIVIDQAELLLRAYRSAFLITLNEFLKQERTHDLYRLILVLDSETAVKALQLMNNSSSHHLTIIHVPKVSREAVVEQYGESFVREVYDVCEGNIGVAVDYEKDLNKPKEMSAREYYQKVMQGCIRWRGLEEEITEEEYEAAKGNQN